MSFEYNKKDLSRNATFDTQITMRLSSEMRDKINEHNINASELFRQAVAKELKKRE